MARYLHIDPAVTLEMTPEETSALRRAGSKLLDREEAARIEHTKAIVKSGGMRII